MKFVPIIHPSISNHCVGIQVCDTKLCLILGSFFRAGNNITGGSNRVVDGLTIGVLNEGGK